MFVEVAFLAFRHEGQKLDVFLRGGIISHSIPVFLGASFREVGLKILFEPPVAGVIHLQHLICHRDTGSAHLLQGEIELARSMSFGALVVVSDDVEILLMACFDMLIEHTDDAAFVIIVEIGVGQHPLIAEDVLL